MTNKERLLSLLGFAPSDDNALDGALLDFNIPGSETYTVGNAIQVKKCAISVMELLLTTPDTMNENGYRIIYDRAAVQARVKLLKGELGIKDGSMPTITAKKVW